MPIIDNKILTPMTYVKDLSRKPTPSETLTYQSLQGKFDQGAEDLRVKHNSLIDDIIAKNLSISNEADAAHITLQNQITSNDGKIITLQGRATVNENNILLKANKSETYTKTEIDTNQATKYENSLKANISDVYNKTELDPFLRGGDTLIKYEVFTIVSSNNGNSTFTYTDKNSNSIIGTLDVSGNQIFTLLEGTYDLGQNRINMTINDTLQRSVASGGLIEIDSTHIALSSPEGNGAEVTIQYFERINVIGTGLIVQGTVKPPSTFYWYKEV